MAEEKLATRCTNIKCLRVFRVLPRTSEKIELLNRVLAASVTRADVQLQIQCPVCGDKFAKFAHVLRPCSYRSVHHVRLARAFRKRHLCSIGEIIRRLRIEAACRELLESNATIAEVALPTRFSDRSHRRRVLTQYVGVSPSQFRRSRS
jgi:AraC-like DNA-binding protein